MDKKKRFDKICSDIKSLKIQGATNIARRALDAYYLYKTKSAKKKLESLRPTEPMLMHVLNLAESHEKHEILSHFTTSQDSINKSVFRMIKNHSVIYTHCHSNNVIKSLIYSKKNKKKFIVYNTETRPLFQGRKTAKELTKAKIKVTLFVDSAINIVLTGSQRKEENTIKVNYVFLGADAILNNGVINKVGSGMIAELAFKNKIPVYIIADSWKYSKKLLKLEQRSIDEVWNKKNIAIKNPAFEFIDKKYIKAIVSEKGVLSYNVFLRSVEKNL